MAGTRVAVLETVNKFLRLRPLSKVNIAVTIFVVLAGGSRKSGSFWYRIFPVLESIRIAARAVKSSSGEKDQSGATGNNISKTTRLAPAERNLRTDSFLDLLDAYYCEVSVKHIYITFCTSSIENFNALTTDVKNPRSVGVQSHLGLIF